MMKYQFYFKLISNSIIVTLSRYNIFRAVNYYLGVLAEVTTCISARWTSVVRCKWKLPIDFFFTFKWEMLALLTADHRVKSRSDMISLRW